LGDTIITLDIDWAPDFMIDQVASILLENNVKATWFVTHSSPIVDSLKRYPELFELGMHPNFLPGSTQGSNESEIIEFMLSLLPGAQSMRTHGVVQSGPLLANMVKKTSVSVDATIFLPEMEGIKCVKHLTPFGSLIRVPTYWADDYELLKLSSKWSPLELLKKQGLQVYNFHPIHVYLNTPSNDHYMAFKQAGLDFGVMKPSDVEPYIYEGIGVRDFFCALLKEAANSGRLMKEFKGQF